MGYRRGSGCRGLLASGALLLLVPAVAHAADGTTATAGIYTCIDDRGRRLTSDRPILECNAREQRVLNSDGSLKSVRPPTLTADERAEQEAKERRVAEQRVAQADAARRDRNLLQRYKTEAAHQRAREAALETVRAAQKVTQARLQDLDRDHRRLSEEGQFYQGKPLPIKLKSQVDANEAALAAQRDSVAGQQAEVERINRFYDAELERLRRLWAGATPGSLGPIEYGVAPPVGTAGAPAPARP